MSDMTLLSTGSLFINHDTNSPSICSGRSACLFDLLVTPRVSGHGTQEVSSGDDQSNYTAMGAIISDKYTNIAF